MRIKIDFITNSSSTSFIVWGTEIEKEKIKEKLGDKLFEFFRDDEYYYNGETKKDFLSGDLFYECLENYISKIEKDLDIYSGCYSSYYTIGQVPQDMKDDQTLREFKEQIAQMILNIGILVLPENISLQTVCKTNN